MRGLTADEMYELAHQAVGELPATSAAVDRDDLVQEAVAWLLAHPHRVERAIDDQGELFYQRVVYEIQRHVFGVREVDDRQANPGAGPWTTRRLRQILPAVLDSDPEVVGRPEVRSQTDPAHGMSWYATRLDVRAAMKVALTRRERRLLVDKYVLGKPWQVLAADWGHPAGTLSREASEAVASVCQHLNRPHTPRLLGDGLGTRSVLSNAQAQALTRYEERAES